MFGKRHDGTRIKNIDPFMKIIPYIMKSRVDSQNMFNEEFPCEYLDYYIKSKKADGISMSYMKILIATIVRVIALRPALNRFVINGKIYKRPKIWVSFAVHRSLKGDSSETTVKLEFEGTENIFEIADIIDKAIAENTKKDSSNDTDKLANLIMSIPGPLIRLVVNTLMFLDRHELMPKAVIDASPFHTSLFITNLKSLGINFVYHHVYEFGTTGLFVALGKERKKLVKSADGSLEEKDMIPMGLVCDERFCDGLYFAKSLKLFKQYMKKPALLEHRLDKKVEDID